MTRYTVIRYVPDPVRGESVNVGVFALDDEKAMCRFVDRYQRAAMLDSSHLKVLRDFERRLTMICREVPETLMLQGLPTPGGPLMDYLVENWHNVIQFSPVRVSMESVEHTLDTAISVFLHDSPVPTESRRDNKKQLVRRARTALDRAVFREQLGATLHVTPSPVVEGYLDAHEFDLGICSDSPLLALNAVSFNSKRVQQIEQDIDLAIYKTQDVAKTLKVTLGLCACLPLTMSTEVQTQFDRARRLCDKLRVDLVEESRLDDWSDVRIKDLATMLR
jgi:hypothetical protein